MEDDANGDIIPVEIALVEMTIKHGIRRKFIQAIDPGGKLSRSIIWSIFLCSFFLPELPPGFKGDMKINSEKYHDYWLVTFFLQLYERYDVPHSVEITEIYCHTFLKKSSSK